jgi:hypothetical protein
MQPDARQLATSVVRRPKWSDDVPQIAAPSKKPKKKAELAKSLSQARSHMRGGLRSLIIDCLGALHLQAFVGSAQKASAGALRVNACWQAASMGSTHSQRCSWTGSFPARRTGQCLRAAKGSPL